MKSILLSKIDRNYLRIELWNTCKEYLRTRPEKFKMEYEKGNFLLYVKEKNEWINILISEPEI